MRPRAMASSCLMIPAISKSRSLIVPPVLGETLSPISSVTSLWNVSGLGVDCCGRIDRKLSCHHLCLRTQHIQLEPSGLLSTVDVGHPRNTQNAPRGADHRRSLRICRVNAALYSRRRECFRRGDFEHGGIRGTDRLRHANVGLRDTETTPA